MMKDFDICMGTGDIPTPTNIDDNSIKIGATYSKEEIQRLKDNGMIQDSTGQWYDPNNYIDCLYADW